MQIRIRYFHVFFVTLLILLCSIVNRQLLACELKFRIIHFVLLLLLLLMLMLMLILILARGICRYFFETIVIARSWNDAARRLGYLSYRMLHFSVLDEAT